MPETPARKPGPASWGPETRAARLLLGVLNPGSGTGGPHTDARILDLREKLSHRLLEEFLREEPEVWTFNLLESMISFLDRTRALLAGEGIGARSSPGLTERELDLFLTWKAGLRPLPDGSPLRSRLGLPETGGED